MHNICALLAMFSLSKCVLSFKYAEGIHTINLLDLKHTFRNDVSVKSYIELSN